MRYRWRLVNRSRMGWRRNLDLCMFCWFWSNCRISFTHSNTRDQRFSFWWRKNRR